MSLKLRINLMLIAVIALSISAIIFFAYSKSKEELTDVVMKDNLDVAQKTASDIQLLVESDFRMLETIAKFPTITNPDGDMKEKWAQAKAITDGNSRYSGIGFYNTEGLGYNSQMGRYAHPRLSDCVNGGKTRRNGPAFQYSKRFCDDLCRADN